MERQTLGPYELKRLLGRGGMGAVYLAHDSRLSRDVALKLLAPSLVSTPGFRDRFLAEARSCSRLNHPGITTIHEVGTHDGVDYIAFEHVEGENLESLLEREDLLAPERVLELGIQLASALAHAHERGVVHRDLKPANVVVSTLGVPKILDFGLAKAVPLDVSFEGDTVARLTQAGTILGTIAYMAPEQALGEAVDERSDVFSFGCLLYEMLAGKPAFGGPTPARVLDRLLHEEPEPLERTREDLPAELVRLVEKALRKKSSERPSSMQEIEAALRQVSGHDQAAAVPSVRNSRRPRLALAAAAIVLAAGLGGLLWRNAGSVPPPGESVAVMYFENLSDPEDSDQTARMLEELLTTEIASAPGISVLSRQRLHDVFRELGLEQSRVDRSVATEVATAASVGKRIVGQVATAGSRVMASVELVDVASGRSLFSDRAQATSADDIFELAESLGEGVRARLVELEGAAPEGGAPPGSAALTSSVEAYRDYVQGEVALHGNDLEGAIEALQEAVRTDPQFSLAQFRLSMAARWLSDGPLAHQAARRAVASLDRAPRHLKDLIEANALYQDGAYSQAIPLLRSVLAREPDQKEALYILGQIYVHSLRDGDTSEAIDLMERLLSLDPSFHQVYDRLALSHVFEGDFETARGLLARWEPIRPDKVEGLRAILATFEGQPEEALGFGQNFSWIEGPLFQVTAAMLASRWDVSRGLVLHDSDEWRSDHLRAWALRSRAVFHTYAGEFEQAIEIYRRAGVASGLRTDEGAGGGVSASALQLLAELHALAGDFGAGRAEAERALEIQPESWRGLYYAGKMALFDGDTDGASRRLESLRRVPATETSPAAATYLAALEGEIFLATGEAERARERFESVVGKSMMLDWASTCSSAGAAIRDGMARTYSALGRVSDEMRTLEALVTSGVERVDHPVLFTQALYRLGVLKLSRGEEEAGRRLLARTWRSGGARTGSSRAWPTPGPGSRDSRPRRAGAPSPSAGGGAPRL